MNELNAWLADVCGVSKDYFTDDNGVNIDVWWTDNTNNIEGEWNYLDPRCREVIREHFEMITNHYPGDEPWECDVLLNGERIFYYGKTIEAAETACIEAIWRNRDEALLRETDNE